MLLIDPKTRITGHQAIIHPWFAKFGVLTTEHDPELTKVDVLERLKTFKGVSTFKKAALNLLVKIASEEEVKELRTSFEAIDVDDTGMISAQELQQILMQKHMGISEDDINDLIDEIDYNNN